MRMEKKAMTAAARSMREWMASEMMLTAPLRIPTASFIAMRTVLERMERRAMRAARFAARFIEGPLLVRAGAPESAEVPQRLLLPAEIDGPGTDLIFRVAMNRRRSVLSIGAFRGADAGKRWGVPASAAVLTIS